MMLLLAIAISPLPALAGAEVRPSSPYPTPATTGLPAGAQLTDLIPNGVDPDGDPVYYAQAGDVIDHRRLTVGLEIRGDDVMIKDSEIYGTISNYTGHWRFTVVDSTVGAPDGNGCNSNVALQFDNYTALRVRVRNFADAFRATTPDGDSDILIEDSYAKLCSNPGDHSDGFQGYYGGRNVLLLHNTIDQRYAPSHTAPVFNSDGSKGIALIDNLLMGGSFTVRVDSDGTTSLVLSNKIVDGAWDFGPVRGVGPDDTSDCPLLIWANNSLVRIDADYRITEIVGPLPCA
ncbi:hypothetical protein AB0E69_35010 [Kribbella sp. NPDC026611]|uniref:hypothetical protein n=1 Tax=Kribbella sp. NPDC026611 TaxID=3154911 RepID=UPI0033F83D20